MDNKEMRKALLEQLLKVVGTERVKGFGVEIAEPESAEDKMEDKAEDEDCEGGTCSKCGAKVTK